MARLLAVRTIRRNLLRLAAVVALVMASFPSVGVQMAQAEDPPPVIHVWLSEIGMIEFFNFTPAQLIEVSVEGVVIGSVMAESDRFDAEFAYEPDGGDTVVATQGALMASVTLVDMSIEFDGVYVFGRGPELTTLYVEAVGSECPYGDHSTTDVATDEIGEWATDFGNFGGVCPDGLGEEFQGSVFHFDAEGDATIVENGSEGIDPEEVESDLTLIEDHEGGFVIVADNVTLDCAGHRIYGGHEDGIVIEGLTGVTVKNCVIEGFGVGILLYESHWNTIVDNTSMHPFEDGFGFGLFFSDDNTLTNNTAISSNTQGFVLLDSDRNRLSENSVQSDGGLAGFSVVGSSDNRISDNSIEGYDLGFTVESGPWEEIYHGSDNNRFVGNELRNNRVVGFFLAKADGNHFSENLIRNSIIGIGLGEGAALTPEATNNTFTENVIRDNQVGYANWFNTTGNLVIENRFCHNDDHIDDTVDTETVFEENKFCGPKK